MISTLQHSAALHDTVIICKELSAKLYHSLMTEIFPPQSFVSYNYCIHFVNATALITVVPKLTMVIIQNRPRLDTQK